MKQKLIVTSFFFSIFLNSFSSPSEDIEIQKLKKQIKELETKIKKIENNKIEKLKKQKAQPKIGLVLSGGGAKGFAHIGALRVLEKNNIKIDYITGTSIGALIGALYSVGYTPDQIEQLMLDSKWLEEFDDAPNQKDISLDLKSLKNNYNLSLKYDNSLDFTLPKSLKNNQKIYLKLKNLLASVENITDFSKLPIPLEIITTDLNTGQTKAFNKGDLAKVITASMAVPTIFDPVKIDDSYYVDGLLTKNFPVKNAFNLGADIVIGVDVGNTLKRKENFDILSVADQIITMQSTASTPSQRELTTVLIRPDISTFKTTDFKSYKEIEVLGQIATEKELPKILSFSKNNNSIEKKELKRKKDSNFNNKFEIKEVVITDKLLNENHKEIVKNIFSSSMDKSLTSDDLESLFLKAYSLNFINKIYYTYSDGTLTLDVEENPTNVVGLGFDYMTNYGALFSIGTDISSFGKVGTLSTVEATVGDYLGLELKNFSSYGMSNKIGLLSSITYQETPFFIYDGKNKIGSYKSKTTRWEEAFVTQYSNLFLFSYGAGINYSALDSEIKNIFYSDIEYSKNYGDVFFNINWDKTNSAIFPTSGTKGSFTQSWGGNLGKETLNYFSSIYFLHAYLPLTDSTTLTSKLFGGNISGDDILPNKFLKLGGISDDPTRGEFSFNGYYYQQKHLENLVGFSLGIQEKITQSLYINLSWDIATYKYSNENFNFYETSTLWKDYSQGVGLSINYLSLIGPVRFSISKSNSLIFQFSVGYKFF